MVASEIISMVFGIIIFVILLTIGVNYFIGNSCLQSYNSYQPQYSFITGCRIIIDGKLTPTDVVIVKQ